MDERTQFRKPDIPLDPISINIYRKVAGDYADRYIGDFLFENICRITDIPKGSEIDSIKEILENPSQSLRVFFGHYAFSRRGKDRDGLAKAAIHAFDSIQSSMDIDSILQMEDGVLLWEAFVESCQTIGCKPNENQNRGLIQGMLELAQEIYQIDKIGSIANWISDGVAQTGNIESHFMRIVDIRGVGPKSTSTFLRDILFIFNLEKNLSPTDRIYVQPIDRWLRLIAKYVVPEPGMEKAADWIVAGKVSKYCRRAKVSGLRFNMGTTYLGQKLVKDPSRFPDSIKELFVNNERNQS